jgi:anti-anti-sigma factor
MQITESKTGAWTILRLVGKLDDAGSAELKVALAPHLSTGEALALDFTETEYIASVGFRVLLQALKEIRNAHGRLLLGNMSEPVRRFFDIAGLGAVFKIADDLHTVVNQAG